MDRYIYRSYLDRWLNDISNNPIGNQNADEDNISRSIREYGQMPVSEPRSDIHYITVIGQIEGHMMLPEQNKATKYEHIIPQLIAVEESEDIKGVIMILNTVGGDVESGLAISELISTMKKPVVSLVLGGGHSIGVPLAVSARHSVIASTAAMTVHPIRMNGLFIGSPQTYNYMNKMQERITDFVCGHSEIGADEFMRLMFNTGDVANEIGTVLVGKEAVDCKLIDEVGGLDVAIKRLRELIENEKNH